MWPPTLPIKTATFTHARVNKIVEQQRETTRREVRQDLCVTYRATAHGSQGSLGGSSKAKCPFFAGIARAADVLLVMDVCLCVFEAKRVEKPKKR